MADLGTKGLQAVTRYQVPALGTASPFSRPRYTIPAADVPSYVIGEAGLADTTHYPVTLAGVFSPTALFALVVQCGAQTLCVDAAKDTSQGNPTQPSQSHPRPGILKDIWWRVQAGSRTLSIDAKYSGSAPQIMVRRNPAVGLQEDVTISAPGGGGWETLTYTFTATATGVISIWRVRTDPDLTHALNWDHVVIS